MVCIPGASVEVTRDAAPLEIVAVPKTVVPSRNWIMPVAVNGVTVAVKPTKAPGFAGFGDEETVVVVAVFIVSVIGAEEALA
jgi:hypothetical protein